MITFTYDPDPKALRKIVGQRLSSLLSGEQPVLFLSSGGSSLAILEDIDVGSLSSDCTIAMVDDRFSVDPRVNSFLQLKGSSFGKQALARGLTLIDTVPLEGETLRQNASRFEHELRNWKAANPEGKIVVTQGMGSDGHTIGILPFPEAPEFFEPTFNREQWVIGYDATGKNPHPLRVTMSLWFLRNMVDYSLMYLGSMDKEEALKKALAPGSQAEIPARIIQEMKEIEIFSIFRVGS